MIGSFLVLCVLGTVGTLAFYYKPENNFHSKVRLRQSQELQSRISVSHRQFKPKNIPITYTSLEERKEGKPIFKHK